ncbi:inositol monophosphatase family protein [Clostridium sediminicola]|uniref:inositol monophosphatase family protein n=1 Tax=Clostridium sediminicola TaxID=3114879 RepID=UPI0031F1C7A6
MKKYDSKSINFCETAIFIEAVIKEGCKTILLNKDIPLDVKEKGEQDIVTAKDISMENYIVSKILEKFPQHKIIGEESCNDDLTNEYTWILDPIDGTLNFTVNNPFYGVQICLLKNKEELLAAVYLPEIDEFYLAIKNKGLLVNGKLVNVSKKVHTKNSIISFGDFSKSNPQSRKIQLKLIEELHDKVNKIRIQGSSSIDFSFVASGKTHAHIMFSKRLWEISPGILLAREAGAIVKIISMESSNFKGNVVVTAVNREIYDTITQSLNKF